jgi:hypothetical protein
MKVIGNGWRREDGKVLGKWFKFKKNKAETRHQLYDPFTVSGLSGNA